MTASDYVAIITVTILFAVAIYVDRAFKVHAQIETLRQRPPRPLLTEEQIIERARKRQP